MGKKQTPRPRPSPRGLLRADAIHVASQISWERENRGECRSGIIRGTNMRMEPWNHVRPEKEL